MKSFSPRRRAVAVAVAASVGILVAGVAGWRQSTAQAPAAAQQPQAVPVMVAAVERTEVSVWDEFSGRLEAVERVEVRPRVAGAVQAAHFAEGAIVRAGELLFTIDPAPYAAEAERAEAQVVAAQARVDLARSEHERARRLWAERAIAQRELDTRANGEREAAANLRAAQAALQAARLNLGYTQVRAPIAGRVGKLEVTAGNLVAAGPGAPVLTTIVSVSPIYASFDADEQLVARALRPAERGGRDGRVPPLPVEITTADATQPRRGRLQLVDNHVNARSGTVRLRAVFDNPGGALMPGQFVNVRLGAARPQPALLVSERAIGTDQDKKFVLVVGLDNKAAYREVQLGPSVDGLRIVTAGLEPHERIVVNGLQRVRPGTLVAPQAVQMAAR